MSVKKWAADSGWAQASQAQTPPATLCALSSPQPSPLQRSSLLTPGLPGQWPSQAGTGADTETRPE